MIVRTRLAILCCTVAIAAAATVRAERPGQPPPPADSPEARIGALLDLQGQGEAAVVACREALADADPSVQSAAVAVTRRPPSIRAISSTRSPCPRAATVARVRPARVSFPTRR